MEEQTGACVAFLPVFQRDVQDVLVGRKSDLEDAEVRSSELCVLHPVKLPVAPMRAQIAEAVVLVAVLALAAAGMLCLWYSDLVRVADGMTPPRRCCPILC